MQKYKIVYLVSTLQNTAPTIQLYYIIKYLNLNMFEPIIVTLSNEPKSSYKKEFEKLGIEIISLNLPRGFGLFLQKDKIKNLIRKIKPDIIHTQGIRSDSILAKYLFDFKGVATLRVSPPLDYPMLYGKILGTYMAKTHLQALKKIQTPITCSKSLSIMLKNVRDFKYIQDGIDIEKFKTVSDKKLLREKLKLSLNKKIFITSGYFIKRKDPLTIIQAIKELKRDDILMIFLGDGELLEKCKKEANSKNFLFCGKVQNVNEYLQASDYYISSALAEGLPNAVMEGMSCGLPVILSNILPHMELLEFDKNAGELFTKKDSIDLKNKIIKLLNTQNYTLMSKLASNIIKSNLSANKMSKKYEMIYEGLLGENV